MKYTTETLHCVGYRDLELAISEFYGLPYSVICALEASNDTEHRVRVSGGDLGTWDEDDLKKWQESEAEGDSPHPATVMKGMVNAGLIPAGTYLIDVCW